MAPVSYTVRSTTCAKWGGFPVTEQPPGQAQQDAFRFEIDTTAANPARLLNFLAGGDDNFSVDRVMADYLTEVVPGGLEVARANVQATVDFTVRAVRYLVEAGIRQFLVVGAPIPTDDDVHTVAQRLAPESRVVYIGNDSVVLAHAHELRRSTTAGATVYVHGDLHDPEAILGTVRETFDLARPVAVLWLGTLNLVPDERAPYGIVAQLMEPMPSGSHLVVAHTSDDVPAEWVAVVAERLSKALGATWVVRSRPEILRFFTGLDLVDPGLVQIDQWRPDPDRQIPGTTHYIPVYAAIGHKP